MSSSPNGKAQCISENMLRVLNVVFQCTVSSQLTRGLGESVLTCIMITLIIQVHPHRLVLRLGARVIVFSHQAVLFLCRYPADYEVM